MSACGREACHIATLPDRAEKLLIEASARVQSEATTRSAARRAFLLVFLTAALAT